MCAATLLIGMAWILILPPFEGFDETAHYSAVREVSDMHAWPRYGQSRIATVVEGYGAQAPLPHMQQHGVQLARPMSYRDFMQDGDARRAFSADFASAPRLPRRFEPGGSVNWQAQHPPLYYAALAPLMRATDGFSLVAQLMVLRAVSWMMAVSGLVIGVWGTARYLRRQGCSRLAPASVDGCGAATASACLAYPLFVPMFFPEFARLGNDALCLLVFGASWALLLSMLDRGPSLWRATALGTCLGAGLLAKAFFVPILAGVLGCLAWSAWTRRAHDAVPARAARDIATIAIVALAIGGWWYASAYMRHGALSGSHDLISLDRGGGLLAGLREHFAWQHVARGVAAFVVTAYFAGTWTLARLPEWLYAPGLLALALLCIAALRTPRDAGIRRVMAAMLWVLLPMLAGFGYYLLSRIAGGSGGHGAPGWYVSILAPACAVPLAVGMIAVMRWPRAAWLGPAMWLWMIGFAAISYWLHAALYAGLAVKDMETRHLVCPDGWLSLLDVASMRESLATFGWPAASALCMAVGMLLALVAMPGRAIRQRA